VNLPSNGTTVPVFVKCLEALRYLHTLEIVSAEDVMTIPLENALKRVKLCRIRTLIMPLATHPLLQHCPNVEDVVCVIRFNNTPPGGLLRSLASNWDSKIKRLAIPLILWDNPSRKWSGALYDLTG